eukprot:16449391-Heterocapsa_arctica.AAC.1
MEVVAPRRMNNARVSRRQHYLRIELRKAATMLLLLYKIQEHKDVQHYVMQDYVGTAEDDGSEWE